MKLTTCESCPYANRACVEPILHKNTDYLFIGEAPGQQEADSGEPFFDGLGPGGQGKNAGTVLHEYIDPLMGEHTVSISNVVSCHPPGNKTPTKRQWITCLPLLLKDIAFCKPKLIILLGRVALNAVLGVDGITDYNGKIIKQKIASFSVEGELEYNGPEYNILPCVHPSYALRTGNYGTFEKGILPALHFFKKDRPCKYSRVKLMKFKNKIVAVDLETTGLKPCGVDYDGKKKLRIEHDAKIRCIGAADGTQILYSEVEDNE